MRKNKEFDMKKAIIVGASSGIGRYLSKILAGKGYAVGLVARRGDALRNIQGELQSTTYIKAIDIRNRGDTLKGFTGLITEMGGVDLVIISSGIGFINPELDLDKELETVATNVQGFVTVANVAFRHFIRQGAGHLVGISSIAAIRGGAEAPAYNASKAFISNYLQGLRQKAAKSKLTITVTDIQPGFVDTDMAKGEGIFWMASVRKASAQIYRAIERKRSRAFVTKRWRLVAWMLKIMPDFLYHRI